MPTLAKFMESLTQEQDKLVMMGAIKPSKDQYLVVGDLRVDSKGKKKYKKTPEQKRDKNKSPEEPQGSKKKNKGEMSKCTYCSKGNHSESSCMKKQIDMLTQLLENNGISLPDRSKKREGGSSSKYRERVHALVAGDSKEDPKNKKKYKNPPKQKRDKNKSQEEPQGSKKNS